MCVCEGGGGGGKTVLVGHQHIQVECTIHMYVPWHKECSGQHIRLPLESSHHYVCVGRKQTHYHKPAHCTQVGKARAA